MLLLNKNLSNTLVNWTRKSAFVLALVATVGIGSSFAAPTNNHDAVIASFHKDFRSADVMQVETKKDYTKLTFRLNDVIMYAYYGQNGNLMAVVRNIPSNQLPIRLLMELKDKHSDCWISDLFEIDSNGQTAYYATIENSEVTLTLRAESSDRWETFKKQEKL